jgi:hypothetical protein
MNMDRGPRRKAAQLRAEADAHEAEAERLRSEAELWDRGADGEDAVQELLEAGLPTDQGWFVLRNVITSENGADIDHVVMGPAGVFTINTKHRPGKKVWVAPVQFLVDGNPEDYLPTSRREATRAAERLGAACGHSVHVQSVIVVVGAASLTVVEQPVETRVEEAGSVVAWLRSLPTVLSAEQTRNIAAVASDPDTWIKKPKPQQRLARQSIRRSRPAPRPRRRRAKARSSSLATAVAVLILIVVVFTILRHHPTNSNGLSGSTTTTSAQPTSTTAPATFQAVGTVTNGQCVDAWSNHGVEVEVSGAEAGPDCTSIASPGEVAGETSSAAAFGALMGPYGRATVGTGIGPVCSSTLASGDRVTVYDEGGEAFGRAFCTSFSGAALH